MKFYVRVPVATVDGHQTFEVEAESAEDAVQKFNKTGGELVDEELEVTALDDANAEAYEAPDLNLS